VLLVPQTSSNAITSEEDEVLDRSGEASSSLEAVTCAAATEHIIIRHQLVKAEATQQRQVVSAGCCVPRYASHS
jgi:hypothetical protein